MKCLHNIECYKNKLHTEVEDRLIREKKGLSRRLKRAKANDETGGLIQISLEMLNIKYKAFKLPSMGHLLVDPAEIKSFDVEYRPKLLEHMDVLRTALNSLEKLYTKVKN